MFEKKKKILILAAALLLMPFLTNSTFADVQQDYTIPVTAGDGLNDDCGISGYTLNITNPSIAASSTQTGATRISQLGTHTLVLCKYTVLLSVYINMDNLVDTSLNDIPKENVTYTPGTLLIAGTTMDSLGTPGLLNTELPAWEMTPVLGTTSATWQPTLSVAVPSDAAVGTYTTTIYTSVV